MQHFAPLWSQNIVSWTVVGWKPLCTIFLQGPSKPWLLHGPFPFFSCPPWAPLLWTLAAYTVDNQSGPMSLSFSREAPWMHMVCLVVWHIGIKVGFKMELLWLQGEGGENVYLLPQHILATFCGTELKTIDLVQSLHFAGEEMKQPER